MKQFRPLFHLIICFLFFSFLSCNNNGKKDSLEREEILKEMTSYRDKLPYTIPGSRVTIVDITVENDIVTYTCKICNEDWEAMAMGSDITNSDRNLARVISNISSDFIDKFIKHGIGIKYIYVSEENGEKLIDLEMSSDKLKDIKDRVESGDLQAYTILELAKMELAKMEIPSQLEEGVWLTDAYIEGHNIYYISTIEAELEPSDISAPEKAEMRKDLIESMKEEWLIMRHKKEIVKENVHFVYIYKDNRGKEIMRVDISPYDI